MVLVGGDAALSPTVEEPVRTGTCAVTPSGLPCEDPWRSPATSQQRMLFCMPKTTTPSTTTRLPVTTQRRLRDLADTTGQSLASVVESAVTLYEDQLFWDRVTSGYAALRADEGAWAEIESDRALYERTLRDGAAG